ERTEYRAQGLVPVDDLAQAALRYNHVQPAGQAQRHRHVVGQAARPEPVNKPQALLRERGQSAPARELWVGRSVPLRLFQILSGPDHGRFLVLRCSRQHLVPVGRMTMLSQFPLMSLLHEGLCGRCSVAPDPRSPSSPPTAVRPRGLGSPSTTPHALVSRRAFPLRHNFSRLCVPLITFPSDWQFASPRPWNRLIPRHALVWPNTGSMIWLRCLYSRRPRFVRSLRSIRWRRLRWAGIRPRGAGAWRICSRCFQSLRVAMNSSGPAGSACSKFSSLQYPASTSAAPTVSSTPAAFSSSAVAASIGWSWPTSFSSGVTSAATMICSAVA